MGEGMHRTWHCHRLNVWLALKFMKPNPQCDGIRTGGLWEVIGSGRRRPYGGISAVIGDPTVPPLPSAMQGHREKVTVHQDSDPHKTLNLTGILTLDFPAANTCL